MLPPVTSSIGMRADVPVNALLRYLHGMPNRLIHEQSPYLLQHAQNPV